MIRHGWCHKEALCSDMTLDKAQKEVDDPTLHSFAVDASPKNLTAFKDTCQWSGRVSFREI